MLIMVSTRALVVLVLAGSLAMACGGGGGDGALTIDQYAARAQDVICTIDVRCGTLPDKASCQPIGDLGQVKADVASGKMMFDGVAGAMCLDIFEGLNCSRSALAIEPPECQRVGVGAVADGAACSASAQCASRTCSITSAGCDRGTMCCAGTCAPTTIVVAEGGACSGANLRCATGLSCDQSAAAPTCVKRGALGAPCTTFSSCLETLRCARAAGATAGTCATYPKRGEPCEEVTCDDARDFCDATTKTCVARLAVGADCAATPTACLSLARCDATSHKCVMLATAGQACTLEGDCLGRLVCSAGVCAAAPLQPVCP